MNSDEWFGLSYAHWLVLPRIGLQSMPKSWQKKFFKLVQEFYSTVELPEGYPESFVVIGKKKNRFVRHIIPHYRRNSLPLKSGRRTRGELENE